MSSNKYHHEEAWDIMFPLIEQGDVFVIRRGAPIYIEPIDRWVDCLTFNGPEDFYYDKDGLAADYLQIIMADKFEAYGELVLIPPQTGAEKCVPKSEYNCRVKVKLADLYHRLTKSELEPKKFPWIDFILTE